METNLSFWWDLEKFSQKSVPSHTFLRCGEYLKFLRGLGKFRQKGVTSYTFFFRSADYLKFLMGLGKILTKRCDQLHVFAVQTILSFWMGLRKVSTKICAQLRIFSLWRLTWVFDGTWNNFHKKVCLVICFFAVETNLSFWWDLKKFLQRSVPSHTFLRCGEYLKFLRGLGKFRQKGVTSYTFFFRSADYLEFLMGLGKIFTKKCAQLHIFSLWRLTWVFDGTWKNFHKKVCPVTRFFAVEII